MAKAIWGVMAGLISVGAVACAGAPPRVADPHPTLAAAVPSDEDGKPAADSPKAAKAASEEAKAEAAPEPEPVPSACAAQGSVGKDGKLCMPAAGYAKKLCGGIYPEVALGLFTKGTPWTRVYLAGNVEAWNASGGLTHRANLAFDEEVIVLAKHAPGGSGGIVMTNAQASYDVMRWDGTCVSVMEGEITTKRPPAPKPAEVNFSRLEEMTRRALLASPKVKSTRETLTKACSSVSCDAEKKACDKADHAFTQAIVDFVRSGGTLPPPARRP
jgi:hypothetical protein